MTDASFKNTDQYRHLITDNEMLRSGLNNWGKGDIFVGRVRMKPGEEELLLYLQARGVEIFPAPLAQMLNRSKCLQTRVFSDLMIPGTDVINDLHDLVALMSTTGGQVYPKVITKQNRKNGGMGINLWSSLEDVFNQATLGNLVFPFVIQPFVSDCRDIRVVVLGEYREAYWRHNPNNFRNNLHFGGRKEPVDLTPEQNEICDLAMRRGQFPYAHLDLMVTSEGQTFLAEISLQGGIKGAAIDGRQYREKIESIHNRFLARA